MFDDHLREKPFLVTVNNGGTFGRFTDYESTEQAIIEYAEQNGYSYRFFNLIQGMVPFMCNLEGKNKPQITFMIESV